VLSEQRRRPAEREHGLRELDLADARDLSAEADPPPLPAAGDPDGHVVYVRSLTKSAAPGLRVAGIGARGAAGARLRAARIVDDFFVSGPLQEAARRRRPMRSTRASAGWPGRSDLHQWVGPVAGAVTA
jgi:histidinol-phosphate/aromatic aminotransferase/cobyric acid decarboxylase-like protein